MVLRQNTKPKITEPKLPKVKKIFDQNLNFCEKPSLKSYGRPRAKNYEN